MKAKADPAWLTELAAELAPLLSIADVSKLLHSSPRTTQRLLAAGQLQAIRCGNGRGSGRTLIPRASVIDHLRRLAP